MFVLNMIFILWLLDPY